MKSAFGRFLASLVLVAAALFGLACDRVKTPTEPATAQPASMSGTVSGYYGIWPGATVECQGKSAITSSDGTYSLTGLMSGTTTVRVYKSTVDFGDFPVFLKPGSNTVDFSIGL